MSRIRHTVNVRLKHPAGSPEESTFLAAVQDLGAIPGVENFELLRQVGTLSPYTFGFSMEFADQETYDAYSSHPDHVAFAQTSWGPAVADALELDFVVIS